MRFASLGSGSEGNGWVVEVHETRILVDCGFSLTESLKRLASLNLAPEDLSAIVVTHEHSDHMGGVGRLAKRYQLPVYGSFGTLSFCRDQLSPDLCHEVFSDQSFEIGSVQVIPFAVPHDAREPLQFAFKHEESQLGLVTDCGHVTQHMIEVLGQCNGLVLEMNHDEEMLLSGRYPPPLKARVKGEYGHLSNSQAMQLLDAMDKNKLNLVVAAHLSQSNNRVDIVDDLLSGWFGEESQYLIADQETGLAWVSL